MIESLINYLIRSGISLILLYLFFDFFLSRERIYKFNRFYLLFSLVFSMIIPLISFPVEVDSAEIVIPFDIGDFQESYYQIGTLTYVQRETAVNYFFILICLYFTVTLIQLIRFSTNIIRLQISKTRINSCIIEDGHKIVLIKEQVLPYSFFSTVYVNESEFREGRIPHELLTHEFAHTDQLHSFDIIFIEILKVIFWFNPVLSFFKRAMMLNHEFLADEKAIRSCSNINQYREALLKIIFRNNNSYLASSFNYSFTKKRLLMMTKRRFSRTVIFKIIAVVPLFVLIGLMVMNAQERKPVKPPLPTSQVPPPPPPPPKGYEWWSKILRKHNLTPDLSKSWHAENIYETGEQFSIDNDVVTMKEAFILVKSTDKTYQIIRARSAVHDIKNMTMDVLQGMIGTYDIDRDSAAIMTRSIAKGKLSLAKGNRLAPPPPPPPPPSFLKDTLSRRIVRKHNFKFEWHENFVNLCLLGKRKSYKEYILTFEDAFFIISGPEDLMVIISPLAFYDTKSRTIKAAEGITEKYRRDSQVPEPYSTKKFTNLVIEPIKVVK